MRHRRRKAILGGSLGVAALCAIALFPAGSFAATAAIQGKRLTYTAGPGELNNLTIYLAGSNYLLVDAGATISAGPGCTASGNTANCPAASIERITVSAGDGADNVNNTTFAPSTLSGGDGNDSLEGGFGNDTVRGNKGVDTHAGGPGDDLLDSRGDRADLVTCGTGSDTLMADSADTVSPDCEDVGRVGGAPPPRSGGSTSRPSPAGAALLGPTETRKLEPGACARDGLGTTGDDRLNGTPLGDSLFGLQGNDFLNGLAGDDCLFGGVGNDRLLGAEGNDRLLGDDARRGVGGNDRLFGNAGDDLLIGGSGKDRLNGGTGNDRLSGSDGTDRIRGGKGNDRLNAGRGRNRLFGGAGNDSLSGLNGRFDRLYCGPGRDRVRADRNDLVRDCERVFRRRH